MNRDWANGAVALARMGFVRRAWLMDGQVSEGGLTSTQLGLGGGRACSLDLMRPGGTSIGRAPLLDRLVEDPENRGVMLVRISRR